MSKKATILLLLILFLLTMLWFTQHPDDLSKALSFLGGQTIFFKGLLTSSSRLQRVDDQSPTREQLVFDVTVLSEKNFSEFINKNQYVMVNFYAPWSYYCELLSPELEAAAPMLNGEAVLAKVNAFTEKKLAQKYNVQGYPTLFFFVNGVYKETYYHKRTREEIAKWVLKKVKEYSPRATVTAEKAAELMLNNALKHPTASATISDEKDVDQRPTGEQLIIDEKDAAVVLSEGNFTEFMSKNQYVMVNFYAPWCSWSKRLEPEYEAAAAILNGEAVLAKVDVTNEYELGYKYKIDGYPTVFFFVNGVYKETYYHKRTRDEIAKWVRQKIEYYRPTTEKAAMKWNFDLAM